VNKTLKTLFFAALAASAAMVSAPLPAADEIAWGPDYVAIMPGYSFPSKAYGTTGNGATVSGIFGHNFTPRLALEFNVQSSTFETGTVGGTDFYQNGFTTDLAYSLFDRHSDHLLIPFVLIGVGGVYDDFFPNSRDGIAFIADAGVGVVTRPLFANGIRFRLDARYVRDTKEGGHGEERVIAGIEIPLGRTVRHIERHTEYIVEPQREAPKSEVHEIIAEAVHPWVDSDGDGVDDEHDKCPDTPRGMKVDADGCVIKNQTFGLQGVTFEFNKSRLTPNATYVLDMVTRAFVGQPTLMVEVAGHTDGIGSAESNLKLSQLRAEAVGRYLVSKGASPTQVTAKGYGKSQLLVNPETSDRDRELNRRVELRVIAQ
jgi:OOP family OmpA-OmpF porin